MARDIGLIKDVLTALNISRYFKGGKPLDLAAITEPSAPKVPRSGEILLAMKRLGLSAQMPQPTK
jgi:hypothetical protein